MRVRSYQWPDETTVFVADLGARHYRIVVPKGAWPEKIRVSPTDCIEGVAGIRHGRMY